MDTPVQNSRRPSPVTAPGFPRVVTNPRRRDTNLLFDKLFAKNCMKGKEIGPRRDRNGTPVDTSLLSDTLCLRTYWAIFQFTARHFRYFLPPTTKFW